MGQQNLVQLFYAGYLRAESKYSKQFKNIWLIAYNQEDHWYESSGKDHGVPLQGPLGPLVRITRCCHKCHTGQKNHATYLMHSSYP